jgi:hypothetical protein
MPTSHTLQALNQPKPIRVQADARGRPIAVYRQGQRIAVEQIEDRWRIDDEWWRAEISRMYYRVVLAGGRIAVLFQDLIGGHWYEQITATPKRETEPARVLAPMQGVQPYDFLDLEDIG